MTRSEEQLARAREHMKVYRLRLQGLLPPTDHGEDFYVKAEVFKLIKEGERMREVYK